MSQLPPSSDALAAFVDAVQARSRALKRKFQVVSCKRDIDAKVSLERVALLLTNSRRDSLSLSLWLWEDRWCRFDARKAATKGWLFDWFYDGRVAPGGTGAGLVAAAENAEQYFRNDKADHAAFEALWSPILMRGPRT